MRLLGQGIVSGVLAGGLYALMSLGISLSWGTLRIINLAHFSFTLLSAYISYQLAVGFGLDPFLSILVGVPLFFLAGMALQWFFEASHVDEFDSLLITFGMFIIFESLMRTVWSADFRRIPADVNPYVNESVWVGPLALRTPLLAAFVVAVAIGGLTVYLLNRTYFGMAVRAVAEDREMAQAVGVDYRRLSLVLSGMAAAYASLAGVFVAMSQSLFPGLAVEWFGIVFPVVILGGLGSAAGTLVAGVIVGVAAAVATVLAGPSMAPLVTFLLLILTLLFRPEGLFARRSMV